MNPFETLTDHPETECTSCHEALNEYEELDPCVLDGRLFCDCCASEYIAFRCGTFRDLSDITGELVNEHNWSLHNQAAFIVHPQRRVNHI
jgi:hypothetical protein